jgi:hypothetical protein
MATTTSKAVYKSKRDPSLRIGFTIFMAVGIAAIGWIMMTISSSPTVKGASFLWLPAALQLAAGVWLGPWFGFLAGGLGAYAAGILSYGGWGIVDIIMNPIAGGLANAALPWFLFKAFKVSPTLGASKPSDVISGAVRMVVLVLLVLASGLLSQFVALPPYMGYVISLIVLLVGGWLLLGGLKLSMRDFILGCVIAVVSCIVSAIIGAIGATVGGKPFAAALIDPGIGWFFGDAVSAILGLYLLAMYTERLRNAGIAEE